MFIASDLNPAQQEQIVCSIMASVKYEVPVNIVLAIAEKEGGKPGLWTKNSNGTYDVGVMQFNTRYLKDLSKFGIEPKDVALSNCYSYDLAAWRIRGHLLHDQNDLWTRAANYHSRTPKYNAYYRADLMKKAKKWEVWLKAHFTTYAVIEPQRTPSYLHAMTKVMDKDITRISLKSSLPKSVVNKLGLNKPAALALATVFKPVQLGKKI